MTEPKKIPKFKSLQAETEFWEKHDTADYVDWSKAKRVQFTNLKKTPRTLSVSNPCDGSP